jgi:hypothetical protein
MSAVLFRGSIIHTSRPAYTPGSADPPPWGGAYAPPRGTALPSARIGGLGLEDQA